MRSKPDMKPWVYTDKSVLSSVGAALTANVWFAPLHSLGKCRPFGAQQMFRVRLTQGLRPGLCRSIALTGLLYVFSTNILYYFDVVTLTIKRFSLTLISRNYQRVFSRELVRLLFPSTCTHCREYAHSL